jgi:hypothetical protein
MGKTQADIQPGGGFPQADIQPGGGFPQADIQPGGGFPQAPSGVPLREDQISRGATAPPPPDTSDERLPAEFRGLPRRVAGGPFEFRAAPRSTVERQPSRETRERRQDIFLTPCRRVPAGDSSPQASLLLRRLREAQDSRGARAPPHPVIGDERLPAEERVPTRAVAGAAHLATPRARQCAPPPVSPASVCPKFAPPGESRAGDGGRPPLGAARRARFP